MSPSRSDLAYVWFGRSTWSLLLGGLLAIILTRLLILAFAVHRRTDHTTGSVIVIGFNFALGLILLRLYRSELDISLDHFILGDLLAVSWTDNLFAGGVVVVTFLLLLFFMRLSRFSFSTLPMPPGGVGR